MPTWLEQIRWLEERARLLGMDYNPSMGTAKLFELFPYYNWKNHKGFKVHQMLYAMNKNGGRK